MRIGIIGATGFIGGALAREAVRRGHDVVAFSRRAGALLLWAKETRPIAAAGPALDPSGLDAIVNLAGESILARWTTARKERIRESRIGLADRIVESLRTCRSPPGVFVSASGTGFYGDRGDEVLTEASAQGGGFLAGVCAGWEAAANRARSCGVRVVLLRTGMVLGKEGGAWPLLKRIFGLCLGGRLAGGRQWVPWIHLEDEAGIIMRAIEHAGLAGPVNLVAPNPVTNAEMTAAIAGALRKPAIFHAPAFAIRLAFGGLSEVILDSQRVEPRAALADAYEFKYANLRAALAALIGMRIGEVDPRTADWGR